jgi:hypothetical protein
LEPVAGAKVFRSGRERFHDVSFRGSVNACPALA